MADNAARVPDKNLRSGALREHGLVTITCKCNYQCTLLNIVQHGGDVTSAECQELHRIHTLYSSGVTYSFG